MKRTDFSNELAMRLLCNSLYNGLRVARRLVMDIDIRTESKSNQVYYKGILQTLNSLIDLLTFKDEK